MHISKSFKEFFGGERRHTKKPKVIVIEVPPTMRKGEYLDVIAIRHPFDFTAKFTNVPWVMGDNADEAAGFEWGYSGCGPTDFAFNILLHFTDHNEAMARAYTIDFREECIRPLPKCGGKIAKKDIFDFLDRMNLSKPELLTMVHEDLKLAK